MNNDIQETKKKRFLFLKRLYEDTGGYRMNTVNQDELIQELGFTAKDFETIADYLFEEGLIEFDMGNGFSIKHNGVVQIEAALTTPDRPTHYFPPVNIINIEKMSNSQIQQGTIQSTQSVTSSGVDLNSVSTFIQSLHEILPSLELESGRLSEIEADTRTVESQLNSPRPKINVIRDCLNSIHEILCPIAEITKEITPIIQVLNTILFSLHH
jgi:hypothetical protein